MFYVKDVLTFFIQYKNMYNYFMNAMKYLYDIFIITFNYVVCPTLKMYKPSLYSTTTRILRLCKPVRMRD